MRHGWRTDDAARSPVCGGWSWFVPLPLCCPGLGTIENSNIQWCAANAALGNGVENNNSKMAKTAAILASTFHEEEEEEVVLIVVVLQISS